MGLPVGSDAATVRRTYISLAKQHHPDIRPNDPESEAFMKILNQGYEILSNSDKKALYDNLLYNHYRRKEQAPPREHTRRTDTEKRREMAKQHQLKKNERYVSHFMQRRRIFQYQIIVFILLLLGTPVFAWNNWFADFDSFDHLRLLIGGILFFASALRLAVLAYRFVSVHNIVNPNSTRSDGWIYGSLFFTVLAVPIMLIIFGEMRLEYHLKHYLQKTPVLTQVVRHKTITYSFKAGDRIIVKREELDDKYLPAVDDGELIVYYSQKDPRIARIRSYNLNNSWK